MSKDILPGTLLKEAVEKAREMETSVYEKKITQDEEHVFSDEYRQRMEKLISGENDNDGVKIINHFVKKRSMRFKIILIAAIIMLMGSMTVLAVEPLREKVYQFVEHLFSNHTDVSFEKIEEEEDSRVIESNQNDYPRKLEKVPAGYTLYKEEVDFELLNVLQIYLLDLGEQTKQIVYQQCWLEYSGNFGITSDGTPAEEIIVVDKQAYLFTDDKGYHTIVLEKDGFGYLIGGEADVEELVQCLESVFVDE